MRTRQARPAFPRAAIAAVAVAVITAFAAPSARAATVTTTLDSISPRQTVGLTYHGDYLGLGYAGTLNWHVVSDDGTGLSGNFTSYCVDLLQDVSEGETYTFGQTDLEHDAGVPWPVAPVGATGLDATHVGYLGNLYGAQYATIGADADRAAAFQIAIWELLYDTAAPGTHDVTTGDFSIKFASESIITLANQFVSTATTARPTPFASPLLVLASPTAQDQLYVGSTPPETLNPNPVPTPAAALAALPLIGTLALVQRARRRRLD